MVSDERVPYRALEPGETLAGIAIEAGRLMLLGPANDADGGVESRAAELADATLRGGFQVATMFELAGWRRAEADVPAFSAADPPGNIAWLIGLQAGWLAWHIVHHDRMQAEYRDKLVAMEDL